MAQQTVDSTAPQMAESMVDNWASLLAVSWGLMMVVSKVMRLVGNLDTRTVGPWVMWKAELLATRTAASSGSRSVDWKVEPMAEWMASPWVTSKVDQKAEY